MKTVIIYNTLLLIILSNFSFSQSDHVKYYEEFEYSCSTCHECKNPTKKSPCLKSCPRFDLITIYHSAEEAPENIIMNYDYFGPDLYKEVVFSHKVHAEMSNIGGGCAMCHHNNPPGRILPCNNCHTLERKRIDIDLPDLKGAYHRQCIDCHRKWDHKIKCEFCHARNQDGKEDKKNIEQSIKNRIHEKIEKPQRIVFETDTDEGEKVTFYHNEHVNLFGFKCTDCHSNESCVKCHDKNTTGREISESEEIHEFCSPCHDVENRCNFCHSNNIKAPFNHAVRTGFSLLKYHNRVSCKNCHGKQKDFKNINNNCNSCHKNWSSENFNHKITGIVLDENHIENDCEDCHKNSKYNLNPSCEDCHDKIKFPDKIPGKRIN